METFLGFVKEITIREITSWFWVIWGLILLTIGLFVADAWTGMVDRLWSKIIHQKKPTSKREEDHSS